MPEDQTYWLLITKKGTFRFVDFAFPGQRVKIKEIEQTKVRGFC